MPRRELDLYENIETTGPFANNVFYYEVHTGDWASSRKKIDLITTKNNRVVAIEVKLSDWKTALKQSFSNLFVADFSYIAVWHETYPKINKEAFQDLGIGILEVNGVCEQKLNARKSKLVIPEKRRYVRKQCRLKRVLN